MKCHWCKLDAELYINSKPSCKLCADFDIRQAENRYNSLNEKRIKLSEQLRQITNETFEAAGALLKIKDSVEPLKDPCCTINDCSTCEGDKP